MKHSIIFFIYYSVINSYLFLLSFIKKKDEKKSYLYIITGKDLDKFIDLMREIPYFFMLRRNPEKYLNKEPKKYKLAEAEKKFSGKKKFL